MEAKMLADVAGVKVDGEYLFGNAVREPCTLMVKQIKKARRLVEAAGGIWDEHLWITSIHKDTWCCQGRGWNASGDGWVWWRAIDSLNITVGELQTDTFMELWVDTWGPAESDPEAAFLAALIAAVDRIPGVRWPDV